MYWHCSLRTAWSRSPACDCLYITLPHEVFCSVQVKTEAASLLYTCLQRASTASDHKALTRLMLSSLRLVGTDMPVMHKMAGTLCMYSPQAIAAGAGGSSLIAPRAGPHYHAGPGHRPGWHAQASGQSHPRQPRGGCYASPVLGCRL